MATSVLAPVLVTIGTVVVAASSLAREWMRLRFAKYIADQAGARGVELDPPAIIAAAINPSTATALPREAQPPPG